MRILIIGATGGSHIGGSFFRAAGQLGYEAEFLDVAKAWRLGTLPQKVFWHFLGRRPLQLGAFSRQVVQACDIFRPDALISTGMAPVAMGVLRACHKMGVKCVNYSTDDPFSKVGRAAWFLMALPEYDVVFTPRRANIGELRNHGCPKVEYLPFGYDQELFYPPKELIAEEMASDLFFAGMADQGRLPFIAAALQAKLNVRLHGNCWDRYIETRDVSLGQADIPTIRRAISACRVALCGVRHENRDGNSMRTFEIPAVGACMVAEDTAEHREIFGEDGLRVRYFKTPTEMVEKTQWLLAHPAERERMKSSVHQHITTGQNTYTDRLSSMVNILMNSSDE